MVSDGADSGGSMTALGIDALLNMSAADAGTV